MNGATNGSSLFHSALSFALGGLLVAALNVAMTAGPIGVYDVPGGTLTVYADTTARYEPENNGDE